jgi:hypothetical protein
VKTNKLVGSRCNSSGKPDRWQTDIRREMKKIQETKWKEIGTGTDSLRRDKIRSK